MDYDSGRELANWITSLAREKLARVDKISMIKIPGGKLYISRLVL